MNLPEVYGLGGNYFIAGMSLVGLLIGYFSLSILLLYLFKKRRAL
jgi:hypothetical protein